jgi:hypothetical protein
VINDVKCNAVFPKTFLVLKVRNIRNDYGIFNIMRTVHFGMKLYNDQRNAKAINLFVKLLLPCMFRGSF